MSFLFDTLTYLWFRGDPARLPAKAFDTLTDPDHQGFISIVTPWEAAIKTKLGKLDAAALLINFENREVAAGFTIAQITATQAIASGFLPRHHGDPFDRLLIAQALDLQVPIISKDRAFDRYGVQRIWD